MGSSKIRPKTLAPADLAALRRSGAITTQVMQQLQAAAQPGVSTAELNELADTEIRRAGGVPAFYGFQGFPASICASVNDAAVHGLPDGHPLAVGDIVGLDVGVKVDGWHTDATLTVGVGRISTDATHLLAVTRRALAAGMAQAIPGHTTGDIGHAVAETVEAAGLHVIRELGGHGLGKKLHEDPFVANFGRPGGGDPLRPGMVLAIEPIVAAGDARIYHDDDQWTIRTRDGSLAAQFEETVLVTEDGAEMLTPLPADLPGVEPVGRLAKAARDSRSSRAERGIQT